MSKIKSIAIFGNLRRRFRFAREFRQLGRTKFLYFKAGHFVRDALPY